MNKLHTVLETEPSQVREAFEKAYRKVFGIPAEIENQEEGIIFNTHDEKFSIDFEGNLLWYLNKRWERVDSLEQARSLWKTKTSR